MLTPPPVFLVWLDNKSFFLCQPQRICKSNERNGDLSVLLESVLPVVGVAKEVIVLRNPCVCLGGGTLNNGRSLGQAWVGDVEEGLWSAEEETLGVSGVSTSISSAKGDFGPKMSSGGVTSPLPNSLPVSFCICGNPITEMQLSPTNKCTHLCCLEKDTEGDQEMEKSGEKGKRRRRKKN